MKKRVYIKKSRKDITISFRIPLFSIPQLKHLSTISLAVLLLGLVGLLAVPFLTENMQTATYIRPQAVALYDTPVIRALIPKKVEASEKTYTADTLSNYRIVFHGARDQKEVALTFDADMTPEMESYLKDGQVGSYYDNKLISFLTQSKIKATLFLTGMWIETYPDITRTLAANSLFELGNHSYSHPGFFGDCYGLTKATDDQKPNEIEKTQDLLKQYTGKENRLFRFPGGCYGPHDLDLMKQFGVTAVQWDTVADDGFNDNANAIEKNILSHVQNGSIIVMHMNGDPNEPQTANVVPEVVATLQKQGYTFVTISELFRQQVPVDTTPLDNYINME